jgi:hypothetical protein
MAINLRRRSGALYAESLGKKVKKRRFDRGGSDFIPVTKIEIGER